MGKGKRGLRRAWCGKDKCGMLRQGACLDQRSVAMRMVVMRSDRLKMAL